MNLLKKYWDLIGGFATGIGISIIARFKLGKIQLVYSIIILILVSIGVFKIIRQSIEKAQKAKPRKQNVIDSIVDGQKPVKAVNLAAHPTREGEKLGTLILETMKGLKKPMEKLKKVWQKVRGYLLAIALFILTAVEMFGAYINDLFNDKLQIQGVNIVPLITLAAAIIVGCLSNGWTTEQWKAAKATAKALTAKEKKSNVNEIVAQESKKQLKDNEAKLTTETKALANLNSELDSLNIELTAAKALYEARKKMQNINGVQIATDEQVQDASNKVVGLEAQIEEKKKEIAAKEKEIATLNHLIAALKTQIQ